MQRNLTAPYVDDGHLEIVGFKDGWHGLVLLSPKGHGTRLAQVLYYQGFSCYMPKTPLKC